MKLNSRYTMVYLLMFVFAISFATAGLGTFEQNKCVEIRTILNASVVTLSSISHPNNTVEYLDANMSGNSKTYNYTFCGTDLIGGYIYDYHDDKGNVYVNDFTISYNGDDLTEAKATLFVLLLGITVLFWFLVLFYIVKLPSKNESNEDGLMEFNQLKHVRMVLFGVLWSLSISILFLASNVGIAYLPGQVFGNFLFVLFKIMMLMTAPMVIIWFLWIFHSLVTDSKLKKFMERGGEFASGSNI